MKRLLLFLYFYSVMNNLSAEVIWNQFRGGSAQGHADQVLPLSWSVESTNIKWRTALNGKAWSSPILAEDQIIVSNARTTGEGNAVLLEVISLDGEKGSVRWRKTLFRYPNLPPIHRKNSYASPTPFYDGESIFVHYGNLGTACLSENGVVKWKKVFEYSPVHGSGCSPVIYNGLLYFSADGESNPCFYAIDKYTGDVAWKLFRKSNPKKSFSFCTPLLIPHVNGMQIISPASDFVFSYSLDGKELWRSNYPGGYSVVPRPVYLDGVVFVSSGYDRPTLYAIKTDGRGDVTKSKVLWETSKSVPRNSSCIIVDGALYMAADNGVVTCLDCKSGEVHWIERVAGSCSSSLFHSRGFVYLTDETGSTSVFEANKRRFVLRSKNELDERTLASLMAYGKSIVLRTEEALYRIGN